MLNLTIQHFIHLTRTQRYAIHAGTQLVIMGVSIPVWFFNKNTSEPAKEIFCNYYIKTSREEQPICIMRDGYGISLPYRKGQKLLNDRGKPLSNVEWRKLNAANPDKLNDLYQKQVNEISSVLLLDPPAGTKYLSYREHDRAKQDDNELEIIHYVNIMDIEQLTESLV